MTTVTNTRPLDGNSRGLRAMHTALDVANAALEPMMSFYKPYVTGLEHLPEDGRFILVGNHTQASFAEVILIPHFVRTAIGARVRPLADRQFRRARGLQADLMAAYGAVIGTPEAATELMQHNQTILVFPGGGREIAKFKGEEYTLRWDNRYGFARLAIEHEYPIVTAALVGGDDMYTSLVSRNSAVGRASTWLTERLSGRPDLAMPLFRGVGPTLIPRPQRMYLGFGEPITTKKPDRVSAETWISDVKNRAQTELETALADLKQIRSADPYRQLSPLTWRSALTAS